MIRHILFMTVYLCCACDEKKSETQPAAATSQAVDEPPEYLAAVARTAAANQMSEVELRGKVTELAQRCHRPKVEVFRFIRQMGKKTYDLKGAIEATPAMCDHASATDRDLIKPGPL